MVREKRLQIWLSETEYKAIKENAEKKGLAMGEIIREYIKSLPEYPKK